MIFKELKITFHSHKDRLYRTIRVKSDIDLYTLGLIISFSLGATLDKEFYFATGKANHAPYMFLESTDWIKWQPLREHYLNELGPEFIYIYDVIEGWDFEINVSSIDYPMKDKDNNLFYLIDAKGQGIWEDFIESLYAYFEGVIDPDEEEELVDLGYHFPGNQFVTKYSDFDLPLDINYLTRLINAKLIKNKEKINEKYYDVNATEFINDTINANMAIQYEMFEKYLPKNAKILDIGFGSARDMLYFNHKYDVYGIDSVIKFVDNALKQGLKVSCLKVNDMNYIYEFDGIWACASLLHIEDSMLADAFMKCDKALKPNGIMYASFKYGNFKGYRNGRYYHDLTLKNVLPYIKKTKLKLIDSKITTDVRPERDDQWLNLIFKKEGIKWEK